jgi:hypothetical protein
MTASRAWQNLLVAGLLALGLSGCGRSEDPFAGFTTTPATSPPEPPAAVPTLPPETPAPPRRRPRRPPPRAGTSPDPLPAQGPVPPAPDAGDQRLPASCCSEPRNGRQVDAIVVHTTETPDRRGYGELTKLARYFVKSRKSAHVTTDGEGYSSRMVDDDRLAYHATYWNVSTLGIEQVGYAAFGDEAWFARPVQLEASAQWIAHWAAKFRIPIRRCEVVGLRYNRRKRVVAGIITRRGICTHGQLDPRNRSDPGRGYPFDVVLERAREIVADAG